MSHSESSAKGSVVTIENLYPKYLAINKLIKLWWTTRNALLIRPKLPNDNYTEKFSFPAAELVKNRANSEGWSITDLQANDANRVKITQTINSTPVDFVVHYDHGSDFTMWGQKNNAFDPAIDNANVNLLTHRAASTVSCDTAAGLGPLAISVGAHAYLGYDEPHWVSLKWLKEFTEAANAANYALLEGKTYQEAFDIGYAMYTQKYQQLVAAPDSVAASLMLYDRDHFRLLGDPNAKAIGRHSIFELLQIAP